jgi:hypothetical protein
MGFASIAAIERFHAVLDAWKILVGMAPNETVERLAEARSDEPEMIAIPPTSTAQQSPMRARVEAPKSVVEREPVAAEEESEGSAGVARSSK